MANSPRQRATRVWGLLMAACLLFGMSDATGAQVVVPPVVRDRGGGVGFLFPVGPVRWTALTPSPSPIAMGEGSTLRGGASIGAGEDDALLAGVAADDA